MQTATVRIGAKTWAVSVATTSAELQQGLSGIVSIPANTGMLFDLGSERIVTVNTLQMLFSLGVIFIDEDLKVTEFAPLVEPGITFTSTKACRFFLEVNAGEATGILATDVVVFTGYTPPSPFDISDLMSLMVTMMIVVMMMKMMTKTLADSTLTRRISYKEAEYGTREW